MLSLEKEKYWLKFILSGKAEDYIKYSNAKRAEFETAVSDYSPDDRRIGDWSKEYWG